MEDQDALLTGIEQNTRDTATAVAGDRRALKHVTTPEGELVALPTSTQEEDRNTAGQRAINAMWEQTQRQVALAVIGAAVLVAAGLAALGTPDAQVAAFVFLYGAANLVIGFYFGRTNHQRVGGVIQGR